MCWVAALWRPELRVSFLLFLIIQAESCSVNIGLKKYQSNDKKSQRSFLIYFGWMFWREEEALRGPSRTCADFQSATSPLLCLLCSRTWTKYLGRKQNVSWQHVSFQRFLQRDQFKLWLLHISVIEPDAVCLSRKLNSRFSREKPAKNSDLNSCHKSHERGAWTDLSLNLGSWMN